MGLFIVILAALMSSALAAPWRCYRTAGGDTVCFGTVSEPCVKPAEVCVGRLPLPCVDPATVCTPPPCTDTSLPPCPQPYNPYLPVPYPY